MSSDGSWKSGASADLSGAGSTAELKCACRAAAGEKSTGAPCYEWGWSEYFGVRMCRDYQGNFLKFVSTRISVSLVHFRLRLRECYHIRSHEV